MDSEWLKHVGLWHRELEPRFAEHFLYCVAGQDTKIKCSKWVEMARFLRTKPQKSCALLVAHPVGEAGH